MPLINRLRIINFSYNNDNRHILNETFNFYGGENALLSLANGGGKSVLVQLFLQPVVPNIRIQGRALRGFFNKQKLPTFVLLEWKLDDGGGYLLTGIGIIPAEATSADEGKSKIRYFTFTVKYNTGNAFDLKNIPLVEHNGSLLKVLSYREARDLLSEKHRKDPYVFGYFPEDEGAEYGKHLAQFGIVQDEWRNVIARINDNEGGIEEIFQKYKNSSQLLDEWIIKNIEKALFKEKSEMHRLEEMLTKLVQEVGENEQFLEEKELFSGFLTSYGAGIEGVAGLVQGLEKQQKSAVQLASFLDWLNRQSIILRYSLDRNVEEMEACSSEEKRITLEERSEDYFQKQKEYEQALEVLQRVENLVKETTQTLEEEKLADKVQQAAHLQEELNKKEAEASGLEEQLATAKADYNKKERIAELEYSLKLLLEEELAGLEEKLRNLQKDEGTVKAALSQAEADQTKARKEKTDLDKREGRLDQSKKQHEESSREILKKLELHFRRNLLGELDQKQIANTETFLGQELKKIQEQQDEVQKDLIKTDQDLQELDKERDSLQESQYKEKESLTAVEKEIQEYEEKEAEVLGLLNNYGFEPELRFDAQHLSLAFDNLSKSLSHRVGEARRILREAEENLQALQSGRLHIPEDWVNLLNSLELRFETGENYLRALPSQQRQKMLEQNPVLPFAFILEKEDLPRITEAAAELTLTRIVPFLTYEDLNLVLDSEKGIVKSSQGIALACLYEGRIFTPEALQEFQAVLEKQKQQAQEELTHYTQEYKKAVADQAICLRFNFGKNHYYTLGKRKEASLQQLEELTQQLEALSEKKKILQQKQTDLETLIQELQDKERQALEKINLFHKFLENEHKYQACYRELLEVQNKSQDLEKRLRELVEQQKGLEKKISDYRDMIQREKNLLNSREKQYLPFQHATPAKIVEGNIEELLKRHYALQVEYTGEVKLLEKQLDSLRQESIQKKKELKKLLLKEETYLNIAYDEELHDQIRTRILDLGELLEGQRKDSNKAYSREGATKSAVEGALKEVKRLGYEFPLPPEEVRGDFAERRLQNRGKKQSLEGESTLLLKQKTTNERLREKISQVAKLKGIEPALDFEPKQDPEILANELVQKYRDLDQANKGESERLKNQYVQLKSNYCGKNPQLEMIFHGVDRLWEEAVFTEDRKEQLVPYDRYYYLFECMSSHREKLSELISLYELQLANLERNKKDLIEQSFLHGLRIYEEIQWISNNSKVRLQGRSRPVQMLRIELALDSREEAKERMKLYIEDALKIIREDYKQNKREEEIRRSVGKLMSSRELLNTFLGNPRIPVSVYKIDYNIHNSRLKLWEDAVRENSGGEKFVIFFAVLSALMSYARTRVMEELGGVSDKNTSVLIMDNPFGPISSEHLLNPLFQIAKTHRTQLICLSDLKQNSIMNCFNLIYMLKIRSTAIGKQEYLKVEEVVRDAEALQEDEKLEKAVFRSSGIEQISMF